ncbi:CHAT domain-containing protein [Micromonospora sp. WMMD708]|uniref:CHAT domain-containing protein n=1 Tax=Micromonospora sp. WMMD708 TaxID=3403464 RepID=UPI003BF59B13
MDANRGTLIGRLAGMSDEEVITRDAAAWCRALQADLDATAVGADGRLDDDREALRLVAVTWWRRRRLGAPTPETGAIVSLLAACSDPDDPDLPPDAAKVLTLFADRPEVTAARPIRQAELGVRIMQQALLADDRSLLDTAVAALRGAVEALPPGRHRTSALGNLGIALRERYARTRQDVDITAAIAAHENAIGSSDSAEPAMAGRLAMLGHAWQERYDWTGDVDSLASAVRAHRAAVLQAARSHPDGGAVVLAYASSLRTAATLDGDAGRLDEVSMMLATLMEDGGPAPEQAAVHSVAATTAITRHQLTGSVGDIDIAIDLLKTAIELSAGTPAADVYRGNLGSALLTRYLVADDPDDLDAAERVLEQATATHPDDVDVLLYRGTLALVWLRRFERTGNPALLAEAVAVTRTVLDRLDTDQPDRPGVLANLAALLFTRYERHGQPADLDEVVDYSMESVRLTPDRHPQRPGRVANLAAALRARFLLRSNADDLDEAVRLLYEVAGRPNAESAACSAALGSTLLLRADVAADRARDLDEAVRVLAGVANTPAGSGPYGAGYAAEYGRALLARQSLLRDSGRVPAADRDLQTAIDVLTGAADRLAVGHPTRASCLVNLAIAHRAAYRADGNLSAFESAVSFYADARTEPGGAVRVRYQAAVSGGHLAMDQRRVADALEAFQDAVALLPRMAWPGLDRSQQERILAAEGAVAADAAVIAVLHGRHELAVQLLEQGRGVLWAQQTRTTDDLSALRSARPELAARLQGLLAGLDSGGIGLRDTADENTHRREQDADRRITVNTQLDLTLAEIRADPEFAGFWSMPTPAELAAAAADGPVVLPVVSRYGAYALMLRAGPKILPVPLPELHTGDLLDHSLRFARVVTASGSRNPARRRSATVDLDAVLTWLWRSVAAPVLRGLRLKPGESGQPRLWWCPAGLLALLPLHAAQYFDQETLTEVSVADHVVSSYTPTLRDLVAARSRPAAVIDTAVAVGLQHTPGLPELSHVPAEIDRVRAALPVPVEAIMDDAATLDRVTQALRSASLLHFAGHSRQDLDVPANSCLLLSDAELTVAGIGAAGVTRAQLVFLASCESSVGSPSLPDEALHLAGAMLAAGCPQVISTRWAIPDAAAADITGVVYQALCASGDELGPGSAARALHEALRPIRRGRPSVYWAAYCHTGR